MLINFTNFHHYTSLREEIAKFSEMKQKKEKSSSQTKIKSEQTWTPPSPELEGRRIGPGLERLTATWTGTLKPLRGRPVACIWTGSGAWVSESTSSSSFLTSWESSLENPRIPAIFLKNRISTLQRSNWSNHRERWRSWERIERGIDRSSGFWIMESLEFFLLFLLLLLSDENF